MTQNKVNSADPFIQIVSSSTGTGSNIATVIDFDNSIPQNTEGTEVLTVTITPKYSTSRLNIAFSAFATRVTANGSIQFALFQDTTANAIAAKAFSLGVSQLTQFTLEHVMTSGTTSATTFKIRVGVNANSCEFLGDSAVGQLYGGVANATLTVTEYL